MYALVKTTFVTSAAAYYLYDMHKKSIERAEEIKTHNTHGHACA